MWRIVTRVYFSIQKFDVKKDYYKILQLKQNASKEQIKKSFRQLAKKYHPDSKSGNEELFKDINEAHQILSTEDVKKQYDQSRKTQQQQMNHPQQPKRTASRQYYDQGDKRRPRDIPPEYQYDQENPEKFRQHIRKLHEQQMKKYTQQRSNYDNLGRGYQNYERFREETLKKKKQHYQQKSKITQQSVRKQEQAYRRFSEEKQQQYRDKLKHDIKKDLLNRYNRAVSNSQRTIQGIKEMGNMFKDFFKKK